MTAGIVGLGLIGGSFAKAYKQAGETVYAYDTDESVLSFACISGAVDEVLTKENIGECDIVLVAVYPQAAVEYITEMAEYIGQKPLVMDCCGTKRLVCEALFPIAKKNGFTFLGGHPMAGTRNSGFKFARSDMFRGAPMVIVPPVFDDIILLQRVKDLLAPAQFKSFSVASAQQHDEMIAFTSQLAHLVSNAYIKSPVAGTHKGFSAGSYSDMTRVAWLNPQMWAELFLENKDYLLTELNTLIDNLQSYKFAIERNDKSELTALLNEGRRRKEEVDGK